ncbi:hypothetical protein D5F01_LYC20604 [Larimichthys crocea]|uniref:Uncharacterized protein n=1 Tax=Larimichthys crocea TaxID=215358 RepID=A0A6G0HRG3_LARCR|nr:hypothetical protein D5F01_LYC20604 [Larimichthys crocea]
MKFTDYQDLEMEYRTAKNENKTLSKQNTVLQQKVKNLQDKLSRQNNLEEKCKRTQDQNRALRQHNLSLQQKFEDLTEKLRDEQRMRVHYVLKAEKQAEGNYFYDIQCRIRDLDQQYKDAKPWLDNYYAIKAEIVDLRRANAALTHYFCTSRKLIMEELALRSEYENIKSAKETICQDNSVLCNKIQEFHDKLQNFKFVQGTPEATENERDADCQPTAVLREDIQELNSKLQHETDETRNNKDEEAKKEPMACPTSLDICTT